MTQEKDKVSKKFRIGILVAWINVALVIIWAMMAVLIKDLPGPDFHHILLAAFLVVAIEWAAKKLDAQD